MRAYEITSSADGKFGWRMAVHQGRFVIQRIKDKGIDVVVKSLDESCVTLETRCWVNQDAYWDTRFIFLERFKQEFDRNGIEIPFNQLDVHVKQD